MVVVVVASVGHPVAALQRCSVAVWLNSLLVVVFLFYILFLLLSMLFLLLWLWWPVLVILWRLLKGARWRCWRYNFTALFVLPAPCSSHLLAIIIIIIISSNQMHVWRKKGSLKKIGERLAPHLHLPDQLIFFMWMSLAYLTLATASLLMPPLLID